jgi:hypothetical protein
MKASDCTLQARVGWINHNYTYKGTIITPVKREAHGADTVVVEWDGGSVQKMDIKLLIPESEVVAEANRLHEEKLRLEKEFAVVAAKVKEKADAAAALINEAQELADTVHREARYMNDACDALQDALDGAGWYQSSLNC